MPISSSLFGMLRRALAIGSLAIVVGALSACATEPEPDPAWTEEEAYAAAEETFRAYIGIADPTDDDSARPYVTGDLAELHEGESSDELKNMQVRGESVVLSFDATDFRTVGEHATVSGHACVDNSSIEVNLDGEEWYQPREDPVFGLEMEFASVDGGMLLSHLDEMADDSC